MNRRQADAAFESLRRHASAITPPSTPADALALLDRAALTQLQRDAIVHYIAVGPDNLALAYSVLKAGAATFATARFAALDGETEPAQADRTEERELFAARMLARAESLAGAEATELGRGLVEAFTGHVAAGRERLATAAATPAGEPAGDLLEAAGIAYAIAQLLESPPRPAATPR
jgi:hypothetical protein